MSYSAIRATCPGDEHSIDSPHSAALRGLLSLAGMPDGREAKRLHILADVASVQERTPDYPQNYAVYSSPSPTDSHFSDVSGVCPNESHDYLTSLHIRGGPSKSTSPSPKPLKRSRTSNSLLSDTDRKSMPTRRSHKLRSTSTPHKTPDDRVMWAARRADLQRRAKAIKTVGNSPAKGAQLDLLWAVYNDITRYPPPMWRVIIALVIDRTPAQVQHWFSNMRQNVKDDNKCATYKMDGKNVKFRPIALKMCPHWTTETFEGFVRLHHVYLIHESTKKNNHYEH